MSADPDLQPAIDRVKAWLADEDAEPLFGADSVMLPADLRAIVAAVERLQDRNAEVALLAHNWMRAHDQLAVSKGSDTLGGYVSSRAADPQQRHLHRAVLRARGTNRRRPVSGCPPHPGGEMSEAKRVEVVARVLCEQRGYDPDALEPGSLPRIDGYKANGDPAHYHWRDFTKEARAVLRALAKMETK